MRTTISYSQILTLAVLYLEVFARDCDGLRHAVQLVVRSVLLGGPQVQPKTEKHVRRKLGLEIEQAVLGTTYRSLWIARLYAV